MGGVDDADINNLRRLAAARVVRCDLNVVGVGSTGKPVDFDVGGLVRQGRYLHRFKVARAP